MNIKKVKIEKIYFLVFFLMLGACNNQLEYKENSLIKYVDPFIGTGGHGHTYPGASMPFGMMQLSPDTRLDGWDGCSGYHYSDDEIYGFSHTHLSGTGVSDYGDILLMPTNQAILNNGANGEKGYKSKFSHKKEVAQPGYYKVHLEDTNIDVELTVSKRSGIHKYDYPSSKNQVLILDLEHRDQLNDFNMSIVNDREVKGFRHSKAWATNQFLFYYIKFSHPIKDPDRLYEVSPTKESFEFINPNNEPVYVKIGISAVDEIGAKQNLEQEIGKKSFEDVKREVQQKWESQLHKIVVEDNNQTNKVNFYTAMYHSMLAPNLYQDVGGKYRGMDLKIHETNDFKYYTVFSLWDTYRAAHPLYTIIEQERTNDFINTFLAKFDEGGIMPIWDLAANYTGCMIGYHAVPVIADAYLKGIRNYDADKVLEAMKHSATRDKLGLDSYKNLSFIPVEKESESVSKTLEYAYDDWTIAQMAKAMGEQEDYKTFIERSQNYINVFDPTTKFMRGRFRNTWFAPFDPYEVNFNYTEANSWQYSFYVPQDITGFMNLLGGKDQLEKQLDNLFTANDKTSGREQADITGLIGQYAHGNEPSHHMAYLYNFVNKPYKTQEKTRQILTELYTNSPDGISGNEDCGQMSAWYIFSSLGFYPVTPGSNQYIIGSPLFDKATIHLEDGKSFTVKAKNNSLKNKYIKNVRLNNKAYPYSYIKHTDIVHGGDLVFEMTDRPTNWGTSDDFIPSTEIKDHKIIPAPFIKKGDIVFKGSTLVELACVDKTADVFFRLGHEGVYKKYTEPFTVDQFINLSVYAQNGNKKSAVISTDFYKKDPNLKIQLYTEYENQYNAGGNDALIDGILGTEDFRTGTWQGYSDTDVHAIVDLGKVKQINNVKLSFLRDQRSWIFLPKDLKIATSSDGVNFKKYKDWKFKPPTNTDDIKIETMDFSKSTKARYIKVLAKNYGDVPKWHLGAPFNGKAWIFVDEIQIK